VSRQRRALVRSASRAAQVQFKEHGVNWETFIERLGEWFEQRNLLAPQACWVVGVSGGPDSTLLLHTMYELSQRRELHWELHVAHLHHGLRGGAADADLEFVEALAGRLGLTAHVERVHVPAEIAADGGSVEDVARQHRYAFLERVALQTGAECVAVGHHADDNAETILHRICRGTGIRGLAGMRDSRAIQPGSRVRLLRPFLQQRRATIEALCRERQIEFRTDTTNDGTDFTRGRLRNAVLPMLREHLNPNVTEALLRLGAQAGWLETYLQDAAARTLESLLVSDQPGRIVLNTRALLSKQRVIQAEVVRRAVALLPGSEQDLSFSNVEGVLRLATDAGSGKELHLPGAIVVRKVYDRLEFSPQAPVDTPIELASVFITCPGTTRLPQLGAELTAELCEIDAAKIDELRRAAHPYEEWLDYDRLQPPLLIRGRRDGDRFRPLGAPGTKSLSDFFIDEKIEPSLRARTGVLCDQAGVAWVMPLRIDERVKLRSNSRRALRLVLTPTSQGSAAES
jgi:tRNA(Ile)-lysidine synthase